MLRATLLAGVTALALTLPGPALAWWECKPSLSAKGGKEDSMREAMGKAISAWKKAAEKKYGDDYDSWHRAGENAISCRWKTGKDITCTASARPCARDD